MAFGVIPHCFQWQSIAAALLHNFSECIGVEIVEGLYLVALQLLRRWTVVCMWPIIVGMFDGAMCAFSA